MAVQTCNFSLFLVVVHDCATNMLQWISGFGHWSSQCQWSVMSVPFSNGCRSENSISSWHIWQVALEFKIPFPLTPAWGTCSTKYKCVAFTLRVLFHWYISYSELELDRKWRFLKALQFAPVVALYHPFLWVWDSKSLAACEYFMTVLLSLLLLLIYKMFSYYLRFEGGS